MLKASPATKDAAVIAYTGEPGVEADPRSAMFCAILTKPADPGSMIAAIRASVAA